MQQGGIRKSPTSSPLFSIVTVVYNGASLIEATIQSIANQNCFDYEYIVIDGASSDNTVEILKTNNHLINYWQSEPDKGLYDAMNKSLGLINGKFVLFINAGDLLNDSNVLEHLKLVSTDADILYGETNLIDSKNKLLGTRSELTTRKLPQQLTWKSLIKGMVVSHQSILVSKAIAPYFDTQYKCSADIDWVIKALKNANKITNTQITISKYLIGGFSAKNLKIASEERFSIFIQHYGTLNAIIAYIFIAFKSLIFKLRGLKNY